MGMARLSSKPCLYLLVVWGGGKHREHLVQIWGWSVLPFLFPEPEKQGSHWGSFIYKAADVALGFGQPHRLRKRAECILLLLSHLIGQGLQDLYFDGVAQPFLLFRDDVQRFQERKGLCGLFLGQQNACSCHLLAFTRQGGMRIGLLREFLCPLGGAIYCSTCQPELYPLHDNVGIAPVRAVGLLHGLFCLLKGSLRRVHLCSCQVDTHQFGIHEVERNDGFGLLKQSDTL